MLLAKLDLDCVNWKQVCWFVVVPQIAEENM